MDPPEPLGVVPGSAGLQHVSVDLGEFGGSELDLSSDTSLHPCDEPWALPFGHQLR